jgi:hypothetical protein
MASVIKQFVTVDLHLSGNAAVDRTAMDHFHGVLKINHLGRQSVVI